MPNKKESDYDLIPAEEVFAELFKNPKFVEAYDALEEEYAEIRRQMLANRKRRLRREALVARVREAVLGVWHWLVRGADRVTT